MARSRTLAYLVSLALAAAALLPGPVAWADPVAGDARAGTRHARTSRPPRDRFAMAGGCYAIRRVGGGWVTRAGDGFAATAASLGDAEPFHFQATDLGSYLLFGSAEDFLAAAEGALAQVVYGVTRSEQGGNLGGLPVADADRLADDVARSEVNEASGRGSSIVAAAEPSPLADWTVRGRDNSFRFSLQELDRALVAAADGTLGLGRGGRFSLTPVRGCATYPEIEVNIRGPVARGASSFGETRGFIDAHLHMMAFEFLGGRVRCGRPWHRYGVAYALVDCPDHKPGGHGAVLEAILSGGNPVTGHNTDGWPTFEGWPRYNSLTHEQVYYRWLERAWRGGLRLFVNLLVDNNQLCKAYPYKRNSCNEMVGVRLQARRIHQLQAYIDAQHGGPGKGWFRIVENPFEARRVINQGKLAVVLGIEVSVPLDCGITRDIPRCTPEEVKRELDEVYDLGVRQMELTNKFDNAFTGVTGDAGNTGVVVNMGNLGETGSFWRMETCTEEDGHAHDRSQHNFHDASGAPDEFSGRDGLAGAIFAITGTSGAVPVYPAAPHCNVLGLSDLGEMAIRGLARRGIIFDPDHMSARARTEALDLVESLGYSGVVSSHSWADDTIYPRIYELGGVVTPYAGGSEGFVDKWRKHRRWADPRHYFGFGYGADTNGFGSQGGPRGENAEDPVTYPFTGFGGAVVYPQRSGSRVYDVNLDGVAHYGLYPDWIEDLRRLAGPQIVTDLERGAEAYLQMWERASGIAPDACRRDIPDLSDSRLARIERGMTPAQVLRAIGQPSSRTGTSFAYCATGGREAIVRFTHAGVVTGVSVG